MRVARYRLRATLASRLPGYLGIVLLIALIGGFAMGSIVAARRTQSSYPTFLASTNPSDLTMSTYGSAANSAANAYSPTLTAKIARLPQVKQVQSWVGIGVAPLKSNGAPNLNSDVNTVGSVDGLYFDEDRVTPIQGRMAEPSRADEFMTTALGAHLLGLHVGQTVPIGVYGPRQFSLPGFGTPRVPPMVRIEARLVGIVEFSNEVVEDDADRVPTNVIFTPALTKTLIAAKATQGTWYGVQLRKGRRAIPPAEKSLLQLLPRGSAPNFSVTSLNEAKVERAVRPEAIALGVFGAIIALAALALAAQAVSRQLRSSGDDVDILRALGASPIVAIGDALAGVLVAIVIGSVLAVGVAVALTPLSPLGPVRRVYHPAGLAFDWTVLGGGLLVLIVGLSAVAATAAYRTAPRRRPHPSGAELKRESRLLRTAASSGLPIPGVMGLRFTFESGRGRSAVTARSVLSGGALAVLMVTATLTFSSGLHTLVSRPALYGWNWTYALSSINDVPPKALAALSNDPKVAAWAGYHDLDVQIDGQTVPGLFGDNHAAVTPPILSGHSVDSNRQIVLGAGTLTLLHKEIGDTVVFSYGSRNTAPLYLPPTTLTVVGTATLPAITGSSSFAEHVSMGTGALLSNTVVPGFQSAGLDPDPTLDGPPIVFVRLRDHVAPSIGLADMQRVVNVADKAFAADRNAVGDTVGIVQVQRPAEIVNYQSTGATPIVLAAGLAAGAIAALALSLIASVRRRRRDLALLKTLGFTTRQLGATVAWQATITAVIAVIVGVPLGIAVGRQLWILFARNIDAVPKPTVPASVFLVAVGAVVLANVVAAIPGRLAARIPAALVLRSE